MEPLNNWPGKTDDNGNQLPAVRHMLDVAACAEHLIKDHVTFGGLSSAQRQALVILVALHDVGKLSESFRELILSGTKGAPLHWQLSDFLLCEDLDSELEFLGSDPWVRAELYAAVAGHHGCPPTRSGGDRRERRKRRRAVGDGSEAALEWVARLKQLFPNASLGDMTINDANALSWALSGLTVVADWVGSNERWFPVSRDDLTLEAGLVDSRKQASKALEEAGLVSPSPVRSKRPSPVRLPELRPMQRAARKIALQCGPQLAVLEDSTGTGKTEAALILAHRMMVAGQARGVFFALPTMATSDAMYERLETIADGLFESAPHVILTHGKANLHRALRVLRGAFADSTPESDGASWLADNRRRASLATVGVGTVDQALLGVLPTRFSTLRLFGLADKVLIIDEAHSYDPYMQKELEALLEMHAKLGGSAILMTATLPLAMRQSYSAAFQKGLAVRRPAELKDARYPHLHLVGKGMSSQCVEPLAESVRTVQVKRLPSSEEAVALLSDAARKGAACVWIRNAVDDAIEVATLLTRKNIEARLFHARFAMIDRLDHEQRLMDRFGKNGNGREGQVLVATQVVEASLDLDFDVMVSDLAPIGSLIQRAGRLWRHMDKRPEARRPVQGPYLNIVSPDPDHVEGDNWLSDVLGRGSYVYRPDQQWLTARALFDAGEINSPRGLRTLIEAVHGDGQPSMPDALEDVQTASTGQALAEKGIAGSNVVDVSAGYLKGTHGAVGNDASFPTRLGEEQLTLVLARPGNDGRLVSWAEHGDSSIAWSLSEVSASKRRFRGLLPDQDTPEVRAVKEQWPEWRREVCSVGVVKGGEIGERLLYDKRLGLRARSS